MPPTTIRDYVRRLVERGDVRKVPNPADGRSYHLVLTGQGRRLSDRGWPAVVASFERLEPLLGRPAAEYLAIVEELRAGLDAGAPDAPSTWTGTSSPVCSSRSSSASQISLSGCTSRRTWSRGWRRRRSCSRRIVLRPPRLKIGLPRIGPSRVDRRPRHRSAHDRARHAARARGLRRKAASASS